jgi:hypothetical protein
LRARLVSVGVPRLVLIASVALLALGAGLASASRAPNAAERPAIVKAVKTSKLTAAVPRIVVSAIRVSTVSTPGRRYGRVKVSGRPAGAVDTATGVVRRMRGHWRLIDLGTADVGCHSGVPARVRADLKLACSSSS